jgi:phosphatidate cytidylyltransferase
MKNLISRTLSAVVFCYVVVYSFMHGPELTAGIFLVFAAIGLWEFFNLSDKSIGVPTYRWIGMATGIVFYVLLARIAILQTDARELIYLLPLPLIGLVHWLLSKKQTDLSGITATWFGVVYVILPFISILFLGYAEGEFDYRLPLGVILLTWVNDTCAYLVGSVIGKNKIIERLSPGKTWEGLIGAVILTLAAAWIIETYMFGQIESSWYVIAVLASAFSTIGDLFESRLKRMAKVKDSGRIMPGHGGALDRFDGVMFVMPVVYLYMMLVI